MPGATVDAEEPAIVEVDVGVTYDDVDLKAGIEPKLRAALVLVAIAVCRRMRRRARLTDYDRLPRAGRQENPVTAQKCDDYHQCGK